MESWCARNAVGREILKTLNPGVNHCEGRFYTLPPSHKAIHGMEAICAFHDGQEVPSSFDTSIPALFGAAGAYSEYKCMFFRPFNAEDPPMPSPVGNLRVCTQNPFGGRMNHSAVLIEENTGKLRLMNMGPVISPSWLHVKTNKNFKPCAEIIVWMEEYVRRLTVGEFEVGKLVHNHEAILLYPALTHRQSISAIPTNEQGQCPVVSRVVTRGVEVIASSVFDKSFRSKHIYSIRIQLLGPNDEGYVSASGRGFETCQLISRHWRIKNAEDGSLDQVDGDGVIGQYPLLREGGYRDDQGQSANYVVGGMEEDGIFRYQSCSNAMNGSFGGQLLFVPGSIDDPKGEKFFVDVAPFLLTKDPDIFFF